MHVLISGVSGSAGWLLAGRLASDLAVARVTGLDARPCRPPVDGLRFVRASLRQPEWIALLDDVDVAIHLPPLEPPARCWSRGLEPVVEGGKRFMQAVMAAGVPKVIVATSAALYGPQPAGPVREDAPVRGHGAGRYAHERAVLSDYLDAIAPGGVFTCLRAAWVCGPHHPHLAHYFAANPAPLCGGGSRVLPVIHEDDLIDALRLAIVRDLPGTYHAASDGVITLGEAAALAGPSRGCVPFAWVMLRAWWRWRWRGEPASPGWVRALHQGQSLDSSKLKAAGWTPHHTAREALAGALGAIQANE